MVMCSNGHENPKGRNFCGECGIQIIREQLMFCPRGHGNAVGLNYCGECGAPIGDTATAAVAAASAATAGSDTGNEGELWYRNALGLAAGLTQATADAEGPTHPGLLPLRSTSGSTSSSSSRSASALRVAGLCTHSSRSTSGRAH